VNADDHRDVDELVRLAKDAGQTIATDIAWCLLLAPARSSPRDSQLESTVSAGWARCSSRRRVATRGFAAS